MGFRSRVSVVLVVALAARVATAQPSGAQAESLFRQGRELLAAGKVAEACAAFEESQKLDPVVTTLLNLASCRERNGQVATAWGLFLEAERQTRSSSDDATKKLHDVAQGHARRLEPRISKLTINIAATIDGLEISRDKVAIAAAQWNRALPIDGGTYTITARAPGMLPWSTQVTIATERDTKAVEVPALERDPNPPKPGEPPREVPVATPRSNTVPIALGIGALALGGAAVGFSLWGDATYNDAKNETMDQTRRDELEGSANTKLYVAQGLAITGIVCAGAAVWLYLRGRKEPPSSTAVRAVVSPTGISVMGRF